MAGLNLRSSLGGVMQTPDPTLQNAGMDSVTAAAFGPGVTVPTGSAMSALNPKDPTGLAVWVGIAAVAALYVIRKSLPN